MKTLMVMAGGTGGHVYPALAVAENLRRDGVRVVWLGTRGGLEARVVPAAGFDMLWMNISGLRGKGLGRYLAMPFLLLRALWQGLAAVRAARPDALLGMGGFVAGPGAISGWLLRRPLLIHEANASAGLTNRVLAPFARRVLCGFPATAGLPQRAEWTGNPVRAQIAAAEPAAKRHADAGNSPSLRLLVVGGSLGAQVFNTRLPAQLAAVDGVPLEVRHQCGRDRAAAVRESYREAGVAATVEDFIDDMGAAYRWADLVLCRAGAMTVAELCIAGAAAVLVPFPHAAGDHQTANARYLADQGAGLLMPQADFEAGALVALLSELAAAPQRLIELRAGAARLARADATEAVSRACREVMHA